MIAGGEVPFERRVVRTDDGVDLAVQRAGAGPPVLLGNGIGVLAAGLEPLVRHLLPRHEVVLWDYRGVGESRVTREVDDFSVERHAADARVVLDALGRPRVAYLGWSLGVTVGLELLRTAPERLAAFGALLGPPGDPFRAAFPPPFGWLVHRSIDFACLLPQPAQSLLRLGAAVPPLARLVCGTIGFLGPRADRAIFQRDVESTTFADKRAYFRTMRALARHDATDVLPRIACPTLVVAGTDDWVTPPRVLEGMARAIPGAEYLLLPETSHFGVIEPSATLFTAIDRLLERAIMEGATTRE